MRITRPLTYESIVQTLGKGCVICVFLKSLQSALLERMQPAEVNGLCNFHGWAAAAAVNGKNAAETFLRLLGRSAEVGCHTGCDFCELIRHEEEIKLQGMSLALKEPEVLGWLETHNALCFCHARRLALTLPPDRQTRVLAMAQRNCEQLKSSLEAFLGQLARQSHSGGGGLGRAAELLFGYRGMPGPREKR